MNIFWTRRESNPQRLRAKQLFSLVKLRAPLNPATGSPTATVLRLRPSHQFSPRIFVRKDFRPNQLPWRDGRCVQDSLTNSP